MKEIKFTPLLLSILLPFIAGGIGSYFTTPDIAVWYQALNKPLFNPPNWIFGHVWTLLYLFMGFSFYLVWTTKDKHKAKRKAIYFYLIQLVLNSLWSIIFFGLKSPILAFIEIIILWIMIFFTIKSFILVSKHATYLLYPYLAWVSIALILNLSIVLLNLK